MANSDSDLRSAADSDAADDSAADDAAAIAKVLAGDREAYGRLVTRYGRRVFDLARRMLGEAHEAEDVVQQAFVNAYRALPRYDPRRPFRHWLLRITSNLCRNRYASAKHRPIALGLPQDEDAPAILEPAAPPIPEPLTDDDRLDAARVRAAVASLAPPYRLPVVLRYSHGLSLEEISEITGDPVPTVKTHLHRARAALKRLLEAPETPPPNRGTP